MQQFHRTIAGLETIVVGSDVPAKLIVVLLHGYAMDTHNLVPFAHSIHAPAIFMFPQGPHQAEPGGRAWWNIDLDKRRAALRLGPRDLFDEYPTGREVTRSRLREFVETIKREYPEHSVVLAGFSQGGMAICDLLLHEPVTT
jgi:predicted esterase